MEAKNKNALIGGLLAIVFVMAVGYAAFATQLNINGTANITSSWDVHIESITPGTPVGSAANKSATVGDDKLSATFETDLSAPGDALTYSIVVKNDGSLPAKLSAINFDDTTFNSTTGESTETTTTGEGEDAVTTITHPILYSHNYIGDLAEETIEPGQSITFTVTVKYNPSVTEQPKDKIKVLNMQLSYVQDTSSNTPAA
ncbi:MAG: hypothetical protein HFH47_01045 [Bacilli bacterium]|nr:hypothetical protein [Bacilli bacterium]